MYFLDTTFIVGLFVSNEQWHPEAIEIYKKIKNNRLLISKLVIAETLTVLKNKLPTKDIREIYNNIPHIFEVIDDSESYDGAMNEFIKYDSNISFFDSMYVHIMKEKNISEIVSFDSDFDRVDGIIRLH